MVRRIFRKNGTHRTTQGQAGFSLIFASILLTVAALVFVSVLPGREAGDPSRKAMNNEQKLEKVEEAMRSFMAFNGRRPCPADGQYAENSANFGVETATPGTCTGGAPAAPLGPDAGTGFIVGGVIPTRSLGLPDDYAYDDFGRRFTYVVDTRATKTASCLTLEGVTSTKTTPTLSGGVTIKDTATSPSVRDNTMYAYISHGASGYGAYPAQGGQIRIDTGSTDPDMIKNANPQYGAGSFTSSFVQKARVAPAPGDTGFDELLWYRNDIKNTCCLGPKCLLPQTVQGNIRIDGNLPSDFSGYSLAVGDVNGDSIPDLIIGAPSVGEPGYATYDGAVYVVFGTKTGFPNPLPLSTLNGTNGFRLTGEPWPGPTVGGGPFPNTGWSVATGDVTGHHNGTVDIVIGAPNTSLINKDSSGGGYNSRFMAGAVYVVAGGPTMKDGTAWGSSQSLIPSASLGTAGTVINGVNGFRLEGRLSYGIVDFAGYSVSTGDFNGDGIADIIIGAPGEGAGGNLYGTTHVVFGGPTMKNGTAWQPTQSLNDSSIPIVGGPIINGTNGFRVEGYVAAIGGNGPSNGWSVATGDIFGHHNGTVDLVIGTGNWLVPGNYYNMTYVLFGSPNGPIGGPGTGWPAVFYSDPTTGLPAYNGINGFALQGGGLDNNTNSTYGNLTAPVAVGDINGDGYADIIMGSAFQASAAAYKIWVVFGGPTMKDHTAWAASQTLVPGAYGANGVAINGVNGFQLVGDMHTNNLSLAAADLDGDGKADIIIGNPWSPSPLNPYGAVYVVYGGNSTSAFGSITFAANPGASDTIILNGVTWTFVAGGASGNQTNIQGNLGATLTQLASDLNASANSSINVASYASVSPVLNITYKTIGAPGSIYTLASGNANGVTSGTTLSGGAYFMKSGPAWPPTQLLSSLINGTSGFQFNGVTTAYYAGFSVAVGDLNGDNVPDIIMGATYNSPPEGTYAGSTYVYFGNRTAGWPTSPYNLSLVCPVGQSGC